MTIVLLKNRSDAINTTVQQKQILKYAHHHNLKITTTEIENSPAHALLEERKEFKGFLRSLEKEDHLLIHDLSTFSSNVEELVKVFECLLTRSITVHLAESGITINTEAKPLLLLELLSKQHEINQHLEKEKAQGRPKGRMSKSKFDMYRPRVIELLENRTSVSEIAKILNVSRTSLKDYINSRGLKDLVKAKVALLKTTKKQPIAPKKIIKECSLISTSSNEGTSHDM